MFKWLKIRKKPNSLFKERPLSDLPGVDNTKVIRSYPDLVREGSYVIKRTEPILKK